MFSNEIFLKKIKKYIENKDLEKGIKLIEDNDEILNNSDYPLDYKINYLGSKQMFYESFNLIEDEINVLLNLSDIYITYNAIQPAYRVLAQAENIATTNNQYKLLARIYFSTSSISFIEGDMKFSLDVGLKALSLFTYLEEDVPDELILNLATIYMNYNSIPKALELYSSLLNTQNKKLLFIVYLNLIVCYRKKDDLPKSLEYINKCEKILPNVEIGIENYIEYLLVSTSSFIKDENFRKGLRYLELVVLCLNDMLMETNKLHFRKGLREQYILRIEKLILELPDGKITDSILNIVAFLRSTLTSDWLYILEWCEEIYIEEKILNKEKEELRNIIKRLTNFGTPFLYGMREKYDDHNNIHQPWIDIWDLFTNFTNTLINKYKLDSPYSKSCIKRIAKLLKKRINEDACIIISFAFFHNKFLVFNNNTYSIIKTETKELFTFLSSISKYRELKITNMDFAKEVEKVENILFDIFSETFDSIQINNTKSLMYIPDKLDFLPLHSIVLKYDNLKKRMKDGNFNIRTTPILFPGQEIIIKKDKILGVVDDTNLYLSKKEVEHFSNILGIKDTSYLTATEKNKCEQEMKDTNILHVTTHGFPISSFADPHYADLNGDVMNSHCINTNRIQENFYKYKYNLVILNSCHSSSSILFNQKSLTKPPEIIKSNDVFNFPIILLMNRSSSIISSIWRTFDKFGLIFSYILAKNLKDTNNIQIAFSITLSIINDLDKTNIENIVNELDYETKEFLQSSSSTLEKMVKHPYCYATYQLYTLF